MQPGGRKRQVSEARLSHIERLQLWRLRPDVGLPAPDVVELLLLHAAVSLRSRLRSDRLWHGEWMSVQWAPASRKREWTRLNFLFRSMWDPQSSYVY